MVVRPAGRFPWIAAIVASLLAAACIAITADTPSRPGAATNQAADGASLLISTDGLDPSPAGGSATRIAEVSASRRCSGCGVVESIRVRSDAQARLTPDIMEIEVERPLAAGPGLDRREHRITARMRDGSTTSFTTRSPRSWRLGQRVNVIAGANVAAN